MKARYIIIPLVIVVMIVAIGFWISRASSRGPEYDLFEVRSGGVARTVSVSGSVVSLEKLDLGFLSPGIVKSVGVVVGDTVAIGDSLVDLDTSILEHQAAGARANIAAASSLLNKIQNTLRPVDRTVLDYTLNNARVVLETARSNLSDAQRTRNLEINNARAGLDNARVAYNNALNAYHAGQSMVGQGSNMAEVSLNNALSSLSYAQSNYNSTLNRYNLGQATMSELQQTSVALQSSQANYASARASYDVAISQTSVEQVGLQTGLDTARAQLDSAQAGYNSANNGSDLQVHSAQNALNSAQSMYDLARAQHSQALAPTHSSDVASTRAQVAASTASLRIIQAQIAQAHLKAPISGVVTIVNAKVGELASLSGPAVVLETAGEYQIESYVSEVDIDQIKISQDVIIDFDALDNIVIKGVVTSIDPSATAESGVINYRITVSLGDQIDRLMPSMTADLEILTESRNSVTFVPRRSLSGTTGDYRVKVLTSAGPTDRPVTVGLIGDSEVEIISGLNIGDQVILREL